MQKLLSITLAFFFVLGTTACQVALPASIPTSQSTQTSPQAPTPDEVAAPTPTLTPTAAVKSCSETTGQIVNKDVPTNLLSRPVNVNIYLPPCYDPTAPEKYPVLYMLHGQAALNDQWINLGLTSAADRMITEKLIQPLIIVMPYEISWHPGPEESNFGNALINDVIPYMEEHYKVCATRACRAIGGLSRGGNWAVNLGFAHPEVFAAVGAHSAPLFYGEIGRIEIKIASLASLDDLPALYIDVGRKDEQRDQVQEFVDFLKDNKINYEFHQNEGRHEEAYWSAHVAEYLTWYSNELSAANTAEN